ncbi:lysylphosphatidylglycerol synthase domain-containing protein [Brachybacterium vulturis]|uniref:lysylphosphatidylglycerol synthase domain-containing protein n=1 Tax=Brachybacterium vulturis TaxID=2017484 RepID=UPI0037362DC3
MPEDPSDSPGSPGPTPDADADAGAEDSPQPPVDLGWLPGSLAELDAERPPRLTRGRLVTGLLSAMVVIALLAWVLPWATGASWGAITDTLVALPPWAVPAMGLLGVGALLLEAVTVRAALPGARWTGVLLAHPVAGATALAIPGGSVIGLGLMGWILRRSGLGLPVILTGIVAASLVEMVLTSVLIPLLGLAAYALSPVLAPVAVSLPGTWWAAVLAVLGAVLALVLTLVMLRRTVLSALLGQLGELVPAPVAGVILTQRDVLVEMLRHRWPALVAPTLGARVLQWAALVLAIEAVGAQVPLLLTVAIFALGRVLSLVPLTPGGAGVTETVGAAALIALGVAAADAAAAMLLLLVTMLLVPLLTGAVTTVVALGSAPDRREIG